ncbi:MULTISPECIES: hypothetical protein [unclassified Sphingomonas]|uniref:hypothetical protein n=1 Tax=unclassified Sphingomonas TaxID=196159 RepID=UPI0006F9931D|nr:MULTISPECIES: hypothetical protein [unclassified Sphingomonas]KQM62351.1 hypothetical protein ASE65_04990 [Sphingomonas sp. Leaf16]KQN13754.1 hypothetical protein ASE81_05060 [Sphingomonas sp. Leaf29]KQN23016.1 hypothetical protein ASE83_00350 [Sphingomonas sp. Leaf32]
MTAIRFAASIVLGFVATTSAFAAEPSAAPTPVATSVAGSSALATTVTLAAGPAAASYKASPNARYCFRTETTGSRILTKLCKTRGEWEARGVDLDRALAGR